MYMKLCLILILGIVAPRIAAQEESGGNCANCNVVQTCVADDIQLHSNEMKNCFDACKGNRTLYHATDEAVAQAAMECVNVMADDMHHFCDLIQGKFQLFAECLAESHYGCHAPEEISDHGELGWLKLGMIMKGRGMMEHFIQTHFPEIDIMGMESCVRRECPDMFPDRKHHSAKLNGRHTGERSNGDVSNEVEPLRAPPAEHEEDIEEEELVEDDGNMKGNKGGKGKGGKGKGGKDDKGSKKDTKGGKKSKREIPQQGAEKGKAGHGARGSKQERFNDKSSGGRKGKHHGGNKHNMGENKMKKLKMFMLHQLNETVTKCAEENTCPASSNSKRESVRKLKDCKDRRTENEIDETNVMEILEDDGKIEELERFASKMTEHCKCFAAAYGRDDSDFCEHNKLHAMIKFMKRRKAAHSGRMDNSGPGKPAKDQNLEKNYHKKVGPKKGPTEERPHHPLEPMQ